MCTWSIMTNNRHPCMISAVYCNTLSSQLRAVILDSLLSVFISSVIMYSSLRGVDVPHKLHWIPGETVGVPSVCLSVCLCCLCSLHQFIRIKIRLFIFFQGYTAHMISTVSEWSLAISFISFFLTYIRDFQVVHLIFSPTQPLLKVSSVLACLVY